MAKQTKKTSDNAKQPSRMPGNGSLLSEYARRVAETPAPAETEETQGFKLPDNYRKPVSRQRQKELVRQVADLNGIELPNDFDLPKGFSIPEDKEEARSYLEQVINDIAEGNTTEETTPPPTNTGQQFANSGEAPSFLNDNLDFAV
mgnify:CR=1 FL=1